MEKLNEEQIGKLILLFCDLRREYEEFRKSSSIMESPRQYQARMIENDLAKRGYGIR